MDRNSAIKKLEKYGITEFQKKVLLATLKIKKGETKTYGQIAKEIGNKNACRAVGTALKMNPLPIEIPCHRVIKSDGSTGSYSGVRNSIKKIRLLKSEGAI
jgi:methylated-DNA-[protein]-cysteine S-methyltransferase